MGAELRMTVKGTGHVNPKTNLIVGRLYDTGKQLWGRNKNFLFPYFYTTLLVKSTIFTSWSQIRGFP